MDERVLQAMELYWRDEFYNPSATYLPAQKVAGALQDARAGVANILGARPSEIIFTAGATESTNLAIHGVMQSYPDANIVLSEIEHDAVRKPAEQYEHRYVKVGNNGIVDLTDLESKIDEKTVLVSIMYANNEIGTIQPLKNIALCPWHPDGLGF